LKKTLAAQAAGTEPSQSGATAAAEQPALVADGCPVKHTKIADLGELPQGHPSVSSGGVCPVAHKKKPAAAAEQPTAEQPTGQTAADLKIHRLYEKDDVPKPSLLM